MKKLLRPCRHPGCRTLVSGGYCDKHRPQNQRGESEAWHGLYSRRMWQKLRGQQLLREPFCQNPKCRSIEAKGRPARATVVDHIVPHRGDMALFTAEGTLQSLCKPCHDRKTMLERTGKRVPSSGW